MNTNENNYPPLDFYLSDEEIWLEYAKAALTGLALTTPWNRLAFVGDALHLANEMLAAHKERWKRK